jgi:hypothetical protein
LCFHQNARDEKKLTACETRRSPFPAVRETKVGKHPVVSPRKIRHASEKQAGKFFSPIQPHLLLSSAINYMKTHTKVALTALLCLNLLPAFAQPHMGAAPRGPAMNPGMAKLFGDNTTFTANLEDQINGSSERGSMTIPGKIAFDSGKTRFEMNMAEAKGGEMEKAASQMKSMGMDQIVTISLPDKKTSYMIYPGLQAYVETTMQNPGAGEPESDFKVQTTELGKETIDGHSCVKNKAVVTDGKGSTNEFTVWNAKDMKNFPVKIETSEGGQTITMLYKDVKFDKPDAKLFEPPTDYKKYDSQMALMQQEMMKRMGGAMGGMHLPGRP